MPAAQNSTTQIVREGFELACNAFSVRMQHIGFARSKKVFWTRPSGLTAEFIHLHRRGISYGASRSASIGIRVHLGIRVLNDSFSAAALKGPHSDAGGYPVPTSPNYHLRFNANTGSTFDRCIDDLVRFVEEQGLPWFAEFASARSLLDKPSSPLTDEAKQLLNGAMNGHADPQNNTLSLKLLGIKSAAVASFGA